MQILAYYYKWTPEILYNMSMRERKEWLDKLIEWRKLMADEMKKNMEK